MAELSDIYLAFANWRFQTQRATKIWQAALETYEPPPLDPAIAEALEAFAARRREELRLVDH